MLAFCFCDKILEIINLKGGVVYLSSVLGGFYFFILEYLGLKLRVSHLLGRHSTTWATPLALVFYVGYFWEIVLWTICPSCLWTVVLLISASWVAKITGVRHWHMSSFRGFILCLLGSIAFGLWHNSTLWWEHMLEKDAHLKTARKQRDKEKGDGS
jgi:hypothetical protein